MTAVVKKLNISGPKFSREGQTLRSAAKRELSWVKDFYTTQNSSKKENIDVKAGKVKK